MPAAVPVAVPDLDAPAPDAAARDAEIARLQRRLKREIAARQEAEAIAERGLRDLFQRQQEIALLEHIAVAANEAASVEDAMRRALEAVCRYTGWPLGHLLLVRSAAAGEPLDSTRIWHDATAGQFERLRALTEDIAFTVGIGLPGTVLATGAPAWANAGAPDAARFPRMPLVAQLGLASLFAFPVVIGNEVVAVLEFFSRELQTPDESMLRLMAQVGTQLGRVIERRRARERLLHDALHDPLTSLGNRKLFLDRLEHFLVRSQRIQSYQFAVLFVDLDRFKAINDGLGHQAGDQVIVATAQRLTACLRQNDLVARENTGSGGDDGHVVSRLGGDEFTILLDNINGAATPIRVAERLLQALSAPLEIGQQQVYVTASIGIALSTSIYSDVHVMLRDADIAMYHAKQNGRARWMMFDQTMQEGALRRLTLEAELRLALGAGQLFLQYQPIVSPQDGVIRGFEALLRWRHPVLGMISPVEFIPVAEEIGLIGEIGGWVLGEACRALAAWQEANAAPLSMSVNVSAVQLNDGKLVDLVMRVLRETGIAPDSLKLELTESAVMADPEHALAIFKQLKSLGVRLSLDDFGTGYSSLSHLRRLPIDTLKIDRSFVSAMDTHGDKRQIAEVVVMLARSMGLDVVAEGVETSAELDILRDMGSDFVQGYYYFRPLDHAAVPAALLKTHVGSESNC